MIEACFYVNAVSWAISGMMHNGKAKSQSTVWFTRTPWFTWDNLETASTCRCNRLVRFTKQVHRADQALLPARVDSFVGCSLHCALHPPAVDTYCESLFGTEFDTHTHTILNSGPCQIGICICTYTPYILYVYIHYYIVPPSTMNPTGTPGSQSACNASSSPSRKTNYEDKLRKPEEKTRKPKPLSQPKNLLQEMLVKEGLGISRNVKNWRNT